MSLLKMLLHSFLFPFYIKNVLAFLTEDKYADNHIYVIIRGILVG
jgi:hypothetical protein